MVNTYHGKVLDYLDMDLEFGDGRTTSSSSKSVFNKLVWTSESGLNKEITSFLGVETNSESLGNGRE